jgi:dipeptide transport system permease protein
MLRFLIRRISVIVPTFVAVTFLSFLLIHLVPGDPIETRSGERGIAPERLAELRHQFGFDQPMWRQFLHYEEQVASGDLGTSIVTQDSVWQEFLQLFPATIELSLCAIVFAVLVGVPLGVMAAVRRGTAFDYGLMGVSVTGASMPIFWWGLMAILLFSVTLGWTPVSGRISDAMFVEPVTGFMLIDCWYSDDAGACTSAANHLVLPMIVLGTVPLAVVARMTRSAMLEVLNEDYIRTARAKGLSAQRVVVIHALRNALIPVVTLVGLQAPVLFGGAVILEQIFVIPGMGLLLLEAVSSRDYPVITGVFLIIGVSVVMINLLVDLSYGWLDPRVRSR